MSSDEHDRPLLTSRRKMLATSGSATMLALAGCAGMDDDADDGDGTDDHDDGTDDHDDGADDGMDDPEPQEAILLVENVTQEGVVSSFDIIDRNADEVVADVHDDHWHGELPEVEEGDNLSLGAVIEDADGEEIELDGDHYELRVDYGDHAHEDVVSFDYHGDHVHIIGEEEGHTDVVFQLYHDDHVEYETPSIEVTVGHGHDNGHGEDEVETFEILDRNDDEESVAYVHGDHWHGELPEVEEGDNLSLGAFIEDEDGEEVELDGDHYELRVDYGDHAHEDVVSFDHHGDHVHIIGEEEGHTDVVFELHHDGHTEYTTPSIEVTVGHGHDHDNGHDHGEVETFEILDRNEDEEVTAYVHGDHWHGDLPEVEEGDNLSLGAFIEDADGEEVELDGDHYELRVDYGDHAHEDVVSFDHHGDHVHIIGEEEGHTDVVFELHHDGHTEYTTPSIEVTVGHGHDHGESYNISEFEILDRNQDEEVTAYWHTDHWHGSLPEVEEGDNLSLGAYVEDADGEEIELDGDHYELSVRLADDAPEDVVEFDYHGDHVHIIGDHEGMTEVVFELLHDGDVVFDTADAGMVVQVEHGHDHGHGYEDDIDHACMHFDDHHTGIDEAEPIDGGESENDPAVVYETHRTYNVSFEGDSTYVMFDVAEYGGGDEFMFLTEEGQVEAIVGEKIEEAHDIDDGMCEYVDMWAVIEPVDDEIVVRLSPDN